MSRVLLAGVLFLSLAGPVMAGDVDSLHRAVDEVDLARYMGKWYEIASFPAWFQDGCVCSGAEYRLHGDYVEVKNICNDGSAESRVKVAKGKAWPVAGTRNAKLKINYFWPIAGELWIIGLDPEYRWAMVGHPRRKYLWIMSRTPRLDDGVYGSLVEKARAMGYDVSRLRTTDQSCY